jgi:geranylgeranyl reductase family protein
VSGDVNGRSRVLVLGAGPAGCAAGITLARAGVEVCVVDRAVFPRPKICGDALSNLAVELVRALGAGEAVDAGPRAPVRSAAVIFPDGSRVARRYDPPGLIVPRLRLDAALFAALKGSGARVLEGIAVRSLHKGARGFEGASGNGFDWRADALIAADGPGSVAWSALGRRYPQGRALGLAMTTQAEGVRFPDGEDVSSHYLDDDLPCGYGWVFPTVDGLANAGVYIRADAYRQGGVPLRVLFERFLRRRGDRFGQKPRVAKPRTWPLPLGPVVHTPGAPGLLLAGDAGGFIDPFTGEGIWQAMRTGQLAAEVVCEALAGGTRGLDDEWVGTYTRRCAREVAGSFAARARMQDVLRRFVGSRLYCVGVLRAAVQWTYARGSTEKSKSF